MDFSQIERLLTENGWSLIRTLGSARQYKKTGIENPWLSQTTAYLFQSVLLRISKNGAVGK